MYLKLLLLLILLSCSDSTKHPSSLLSNAKSDEQYLENLSYRQEFNFDTLTGVYRTSLVSVDSSSKVYSLSRTMFEEVYYIKLDTTGKVLKVWVKRDQ